MPFLEVFGVTSCHFFRLGSQISCMIFTQYQLKWPSLSLTFAVFFPYSYKLIMGFALILKREENFRGSYKHGPKVKTIKKGKKVLPKFVGFNRYLASPVSVRIMLCTMSERLGYP